MPTNEFGDSPVAQAQPNEFGDVAVNQPSQPNTPDKDTRGFFQSAVDQLKAIPSAISDWWNGGKGQFGAMGDALHVLHNVDQDAAKDPQNKGKPPAQWVRRDLTPDEQAIVDRGSEKALQAVGGKGGNLLAEIGAPAMTAGQQASQGNAAGAAGTLTGGYVAPAVAGKVIGATAPRVGPFVKAAAPDVATGAAKGATAYTLGHLIGNEYTSALVGAGGIAAGLQDIFKGVGKGWTAAQKAVATKIATAADAADDARAAALARVTDAFDPATAPKTDIQLGNQPAQQPSGPIPASRQLPAAPQPITAGPVADPSKVTVTTGNPLSYGGPRQLGAGPAPQPTTIPFSKPDVLSAVYEAAARAEKAQKLAQFLHAGNITAEEAKTMTAGHWQMAAQGAGVDAPSLASQGQAMFELRKLEAAQNSPQLIDRLNQTGAMPAAQQLQQLMGQ
jgi:hypothetical protein